MKRSLEVRTGKWCREEDDLLKTCIEKFGEGKWHLIPQRAGLKRCRKSCRLRWLNYLKPDINRGEFTEDEVDMMVRLHRLLGNRWALIAGRLPGRTPNDVKNYWHTNMRKKRCPSDKKEPNEKAEELTSVKPHIHRVIRPRAFSFSRNSCWLRKILPDHHHNANTSSSGANEQPQQMELEDSMTEWWKSLLDDSDDAEKGISEQQNALLSLSSSSSSSNSMSKQERNLELLWDDEQLACIYEFPLDTNLCDFLS